MQDFFLNIFLIRHTFWRLCGRWKAAESTTEHWTAARPAHSDSACCTIGFIPKKLLRCCLSLVLPLRLTSFCRNNMSALSWRTIHKGILRFYYSMSDVKHYGKRVWEHCSTKWPIFYKTPQTDGRGDLTNTKFKKKNSTRKKRRVNNQLTSEGLGWFWIQ